LAHERPLGAFGGVIILAFIFVAIFADLLAPHTYDGLDFDNMLAAPGLTYPLGTDQLGRDLLSRIIFGARVSIYVVVGAVTLQTILTLFLGVVPVWYGGRWDTWTQRLLVDTWITLPRLLMLLSLSSLLGQSLWTMILILSLGGFSSSRVIRGVVLTLKETPFVDAARAIGASTPRLLLRHIVPNTFAPLMVLATLDVGSVILAESSLSFLGYGIPPPFPSWGRMLGSDALDFYSEAPWLMLWPGLVLTSVIFGANVFGDAMRDVLDPRMRGSGRTRQSRRK
jgi:peptide/nickel transport system permease protein